ncbi:MAG: response regulator [Bacteroidota bacterium]
MDYTNSIIFAEDNPQDLQLFKYALSQIEKPIQLIHYENGQECLAAIATIYPPSIACFLIDLNMPYVNGFELIEALRKNSDFEHTPIVVFTSTNSNEERLKSFQVGANAYVAKPTELEELVEVVDHIIRFWVYTNQRVV